MKPIMMLTAAFALPALLATAPVAAQWTGKPYRAVGTEPFWSIDIDRKSITYRPIHGRAIKVAKPRAIAVRGGTTYRSRGITVTITKVRCSDGMSDHTFADTVRVTIGRQVLNGCGGGVLAVGGRALRVT